MIMAFSTFKTIITTIALSAIAGPALAEAARQGAGYQDTGRFFDDREKSGWFYYEELPTPTPELTPTPEPTPEPAPPAPPAPPQQQVPEPPPPMSVEWLNVNLPKYLNIAVNNPTHENVRSYLFIQQRAMEMSKRFAQVAQQVTAGDPLFDNQLGGTRNEASQAALGRERRVATNQALDQLSNEIILLFYYEANCTICIQQSEWIGMLANYRGFDMLLLSIDGSSPQEAQLSGAVADFDWVHDKTQGESVGLIGTPALAMLTSTGDTHMVASGSSGQSATEERLIRVSFREGLIDSELYYSTSGAGDEIMQTENFQALLTNPFAQAMMTDEDGFIPPEDLLLLLEEDF